MSERLVVPAHRLLRIPEIEQGAANALDRLCAARVELQRRLVEGDGVPRPAECTLYVGSVDEGIRVSVVKRERTAQALKGCLPFPPLPQPGAEVGLRLGVLRQQFSGARERHAGILSLARLRNAQGLPHEPLRRLRAQ